MVKCKHKTMYAKSYSKDFYIQYLCIKQWLTTLKNVYQISTKMRAYEVAGYFCLLTCSIFANKYVLSVLGFQFPMVFQGWQTLVGCIVFKVRIIRKF